MVTIIEPFSEIKLASDCVEYRIGADALPGADTILKIGYRLYTQDVGGGNVMAMMPMKTRRVTSLTDEIRFDATPMIVAAFSTEVPTLSGALNPLDTVDVGIDNSGFAKEFYVEYYHIEIDTTDGTSTTQTLTSTTLTMLNSYAQDYQIVSRDPNMVLTDSNTISVAKGQYEWIRVHGAYTVEIDCYTHGNPTPTQLNYTGSDQLFPSGPAQLPLPDGTCKYVVKFMDGVDVDRSITYHVVKSFYDVEDRIDIYFLSPKGSWHSMSFEFGASETVNRDIREICRSRHCPTSFADLFSNHGRSIVSNRSWISFKMKAMKKTNHDNIERIRSFANARQYRAVYRFAEGSRAQYLAPIIPQIRNIPINDEKKFFNFQFTAYYGLDLSHE